MPSTRVTATARFAPDTRGATAAVLRVHGPPRVTGPPTRAQRLAADLRAGLREAAAPLPGDARALLPGLVVGDTAGLPAELKEAFKATDLVHLTAVSGANLTIVLDPADRPAGPGDPCRSAAAWPRGSACRCAGPRCSARPSPWASSWSAARARACCGPPRAA